MNIFRLDKHVTIQKRTTSFDAIGNELSEWADYYNCHATINNVSGNERHKDGHVIPTEIFNLVVRACEKTKILNAEDYRVFFNGEIYDIKHVFPYNFARCYVKIDVERAINGNKM